VHKESSLNAGTFLLYIQKENTKHAFPSSYISKKVFIKKHLGYIEHAYSKETTGPQ
jgi:hypothetical protein